MRSLSALGNLPEAPPAPQRDPDAVVLHGDEVRVVTRALASAHHALAQMPPHLRPNGEIAGINRLLRRLLGDNWHQLAGVTRYRVK